MLHEDTVKNRYSFEESRNLSRVREYRAFQRLQPLPGKCTPSAFGISSYGKATHDDLSVASLLRYGCHRLTTICASLRSFKLCSLVQLMFAATPEGETRNLQFSSSRPKAKGSMPRSQ